MTEAKRTDTTIEAALLSGRGDEIQRVLDVAAYCTLFEKLKDLEHAVDEQGNPSSALLKCASALLSVIQFLNSDPAIHMLGLASPLERLFAAVHDKVQGRKAPLLDDVEHHAGRPTGRFQDLVIGLYVAALETLIAAKLSPQVAADWLETEIYRAGMTYPDGSGSRIKAAQCLRWRYRVQSGDAPAAQTELVEQMRSERANGPAVAATEHGAKQQARVYLKIAKRYEFPQTPNVDGSRSPSSSF